jgi:DNA-directed RNA polymerase specialized sigma24 family protein
MTGVAIQPQMGCPVCQAVPGTPHSPHCADPSGAGRRLAAARLELEDAMTGAQRAAIALVNGGWSEEEAARAVGITRMTVRKALGKR